MADNAILTEGMALDEFIRRYGAEGPFEILEGEIVELAPNIPLHAMISMKLERLLYVFEEKGAGKMFRETPFVLEEKNDWVKGSRVPDVMFYTQSRYEQYTQETADWELKPFALVPDLVIEVVSPGDTVTHLERKVDLYLQDGVKLVWVVNPMRKTVHVYTIGSKTITLLNTDDTLTGGDVLADFTVPVKDIFAV